MRRSTAIIGIGHTDWRADWRLARGGAAETDSYGYAARAFRNALADAGITRRDIDGLIAGPTTAYERTGEILGLDVRWGGQGDAAQAMMHACLAIEAGMAKVIALVYGNNQRSGGTQYGGPQAMGGANFLSYVYHAPWGFTSQGALYAMMFRRYQHVRGFSEADLGQVAAAERAWAALNPAAIMQKHLTLEDYLAAEYVCEPLRLLDYCMVNDGGVALIVAEAEWAQRIASKPVYIRGLGRSELNRRATTLEMRLTDFYLPAQQAAAAASYADAGLGPEDIDVLQVYDSFSVHVPLALEGYGYCPVGEAACFLRDAGVGPGSRLPTNTSGGHLSESYMQGWNHQIECVRQLRCEAGTRQVANCRHVHYTSDVAGKAMSIIYGR
jgi:acetyl-CoA acetyltransferase